MKQISFEELQEITREIVGKLYMYKNVSILYDEKKARSLFNALCTTSIKEISNPCMIHKTENEFIYLNLLEERGIISITISS